MINIPTWHERAMRHPDHQTGMVSEDMIRARMCEEIEDLRAEVERLHRAHQAACEGGDLLRAENERLIRERDEARSKETDYHEGFEEGWDAAQEAAAAVVERLREALIAWDALIKHQFSGSREAMSDMQHAALTTKRILDGLEAKP